MLQGYKRVTERGVDVFFAELDRSSAERTSSVLCRAAAELSARFGMARPCPPIRAVLAPDRDEFDRLVADLLRVEIERPSDSHRIAQAQKTDIVLLAPRAYATHSAYAHEPADYRRMLRHELVHVLHESVSPDMERSPLWFDEGLAVVLSHQWRYESQFRFREPVLEAVRGQGLPPFSEVQADRGLAYSFGWTVVRFIEQRWGWDSVLRIMREMEDGDVLAHLAVTADEFERRWREWLVGAAWK
jgi:hypothetical protein